MKEIKIMTIFFDHNLNQKIYENTVTNESALKYFEEWTISPDDEASSLDDAYLKFMKEYWLTYNVCNANSCVYSDEGYDDRYEPFQTRAYFFIDGRYDDNIVIGKE